MQVIRSLTELPFLYANAIVSQSSDSLVESHRALVTRYCSSLANTFVYICEFISFI